MPATHRPHRSRRSHRSLFLAFAMALASAGAPPPARAATQPPRDGATACARTGNGYCHLPAPAQGLRLDSELALTPASRSAPLLP
ncbi:hypothetical protein [Cupriavidus sp. USMAHM13]|uniref:hypothetical protein n=1 Tax=Cupriavidus sp. USMAHM13 TaxID=1389192 RepID=UPI0012EA172A|nr:hypothetical protein [Cupriavidus sp. USMAHM13]